MSAATQIALVRTGTANVASVCAALRREGREPVLTEEPGVIRDAAHVVLPGVGAFGAAMASLERAGLVDALRERFAAGRSTLAVCLGLQLLAEGSDEAPGVEGLGVIPGRARRFEGELRVPHLGWNDITPERSGGMLAPGYAYFANTYHLTAVPPDWSAAHCEYGTTFVAAAERGALLACQFHPELSGDFGRDLIRRWLASEPC